MIGHAATMTGNTMGGAIGDAYGIRMSFIVGAAVSGAMMLPALFLTSDSVDPITARLAADAEEKRRALGMAAGGDADPEGNPVKLVVVTSPLEAGGAGSGADDARRARVKEMTVAAADPDAGAAAALNEARVLAAVRAHAHGVR